ncbi:GNAT family N-acetyltransferase [Streptomyces sp. MUSC 14]|uniref:GNAT family N-acetyltransferase n=1 Tax=Streptomyces sp. MUSC 14 TaxID=1354889 RepID=UPI0009A0AEEB|nr:GNAT family N-acetyltransferase [Streptomyces sp. MUSC 14]
MADVVPFDPAHLAGVLDLCRSEGWFTFSASPERAEASLTAPGVVALVAVEGTRVVGFAQALTDGVVQAHLSLLATAHDRRRTGIGRSLVQETLRRCGAMRMDLVTDTAEEFYAALPHRRFHGFRIYGDVQPSGGTS